MTLQQLEYLVAVDRLQHFGRAAHACHVSQPTLSAMLQKLETELGVTLFERSAKGVRTTTVGHRVVEMARLTLTAAERLKQVVEEETQGVQGTFRLGILPTIAPYLLPRFFPQLCRQCPALDLRVTELQTYQLKEALAVGELDAAILADVGDWEGYGKHLLYYEQFLAYVSEGDALFGHRSIKSCDLQHESLWLLDEGHCFRDQLVKFCSLKSASASRRAYTLGSIETFMRMVEAGQGITFIPELALQQLSETQRRLVRPFALPIPTRSVVLITPPHFVRNRVADLLAERIRACVPSEMLKLNNTEQRV